MNGVVYTRRCSVLGALAVSTSLLFGLDVRAAQIAISVSGSGNWNYVSQVVPNPPGTLLFASGSSVTIETDTDQDGVIGDISLVGGTLKVAGTLPLGALGSFIFDMEESESGAIGSLSGSQILWATPASLQMNPGGTFQCTGVVCTLAGLSPATSYPIAVFFGAYGDTPLSSAPLGTWEMSGPLDQILGSNRQTIALGGPTPPPGQGQPSEWYVFGRQDLGFVPVPEPATAGPFGMGLVAMALASRRPLGPLRRGLRQPDERECEQGQRANDDPQGA